MLFFWLVLNLSPVALTRNLPSLLVLFHILTVVSVYEFCKQNYVQLYHIYITGQYLDCQHYQYLKVNIISATH